MFKWGIRNRLIFSYLLLILMSMVFFGSYILWFFYDHNVDSVTNLLITQAKTTEEFLKLQNNVIIKDPLLDERIKELAYKINLRITIINSSGIVLADSFESIEDTENPINRPEVIAALSGKNGVDIRYNDLYNTNWLYVSIPLYQNSNIVGVVRVSTSLAHVETGFNKIISALLAALFLTTLIAVALSIRLAKKFTAPLEAITETAEQFAGGNLKQRIHIRTGDEIEILAHTLNNLASNLDDKVREIVAEKTKLELILERMDNAVIVVDKYSHVVTVNKMATEIFNISSTMIGQHNIHVIGNSMLDRAITQCIQSLNHKPISLKTNINNTKRIFQVFLAPILTDDTDIIGVLCVFHDITALQEMHQRQADFVANASHELATPLTAIKGFAETLLDGALYDTNLSNKFIEIIYNEADRMHRLVNDLLQLAKLESEDYRQHIKLVPTEVSNIFQQILEELAPHWERKQIEVITEYKLQPLPVLANFDWLKQLLVNLIENAIKYTPPRGKVYLKYYHDETHAYFIVKDSGPGIPAKDIPLIFDRFFRVDRARTRSGGGTGLGLAIVKFISDILGGTITVKSDINVGTTFIFSIPLASQEQKPS